MSMEWIHMDAFKVALCFAGYIAVWIVLQRFFRRRKARRIRRRILGPPEDDSWTMR